MRTKPSLVALAFLCLSAASVTHADDHGYGGPYGYGGEYKEKYYSGPCKIERKQEDDGEYKEERKCKGAPLGYEHKEKFRQGPCKVEREWKRDGEYKEKVECKR